jgi:protein SCO1/2
MYNLIFKGAVVTFVIMMAAVFFWQPISMTFSNAPVTNDFVLQTADGALDTKALRGKVLTLVFAHAGCDGACKGRLAKVTRAYEMLSASERNQTMMVLVSVNPERDTPAAIGSFAKSIHPGFVGATGKPDEIKAVTDAFAVHVINQKLPDGSQVIEASPLTYLVGPDGRFVAVLNEAVSEEKVAAAVRKHLPAMLPPGR